VSELVGKGSNPVEYDSGQASGDRSHEGYTENSKRNSDKHYEQNNRSGDGIGSGVQTQAGYFAQFVFGHAATSLPSILQQKESRNKPLVCFLCFFFLPFITRFSSKFMYHKDDTFGGPYARFDQ
jgi:hypothetical protein